MEGRTRTDAEGIDRLEALRQATRRAVTDGPGHLPAAFRRSLVEGASPEGLEPLLAKIRTEAFKVTDADIARLLTEVGGAYSEDALYELVVATALGAAEQRAEAALAALEAA